jgi:hypothetical protein
MWFSFSTNVLIFVTALVIGLAISKNVSNKNFILFLHLTGIAALIAAFGHLPILESSLQKGLLFTSRIVNLLSIFFFVRGTVRYFNHDDKRWVNASHYGLILIFLTWLLFQNAFSPVMLYGIIGMAVISLSLFLRYFSTNRVANGLIITGLFLLIFSAAIFSIFKNLSYMTPADLSHILVALSLVIMSRGFKRMDLYEVSLQS